MKKEIVIYLIAACTSLIVLSYAVHMFVGGLVSIETERLLMVIVDLIAVAAMGYMAWDVVQHRRGGR